MNCCGLSSTAFFLQDIEANNITQDNIDEKKSGDIFFVSEGPLEQFQIDLICRYDTITGQRTDYNHKSI